MGCSGCYHTGTHFLCMHSCTNTPSLMGVGGAEVRCLERRGRTGTCKLVSEVLEQLQQHICFLKQRPRNANPITLTFLFHQPSHTQVGTNQTHKKFPLQPRWQVGVRVGKKNKTDSPNVPYHNLKCCMGCSYWQRTK